MKILSLLKINIYIIFNGILLQLILLYMCDSVSKNSWIFKFYSLKTRLLKLVFFVLKFYFFVDLFNLSTYYSSF